MTPVQIENNRMAYSIMWGFPARKINLGVLRGAFVGSRNYDFCVEVSNERLFNDCGSVGCIAGILSAHEHFIAQGLCWTPGNGIRYKQSFYYHVGSLELFGASNIFATGTAGLPGKLQALRRIRSNLLANRAISLERNIEPAIAEARLTE